MQHIFLIELWNVSLWWESYYADLAGSSQKSCCIATIRKYRNSIPITSDDAHFDHLMTRIFQTFLLTFWPHFKLWSILWEYVKLTFKIHFYLCACIFIYVSICHMYASIHRNQKDALDALKLKLWATWHCLVDLCHSYQCNMKEEWTWVFCKSTSALNLWVISQPCRDTLETT